MALGAVGIEPELAFASPVRGQLLGFALLTLPVVLYFSLWESSARRATPGKQLLGLSVVTASDGRLTRGRSLLRSALKFLPWELAHTCLWRLPGWPGQVESFPAGVLAGLALVWLLVAMYLLMPLTNRLRQTPYDRAAASFVIAARRHGNPVEES